jgi:hypothetical protein
MPKVPNDGLSAQVLTQKEYDDPSWLQTLGEYVLKIMKRRISLFGITISYIRSKGHLGIDTKVHWPFRPVHWRSLEHRIEGIGQSRPMLLSVSSWKETFSLSYQ